MAIASIVLCGAGPIDLQVTLVNVGDGEIVEAPTVSGPGGRCFLVLFSGQDAFRLEWADRTADIQAAIINPKWHFGDLAVPVKARLLLDDKVLGHREDGTPEPFLPFDGWRHGAFLRFLYPVEKYLSEARRLDIRFPDHIAPAMSFSLDGMPVLMESLRQCWADIGWSWADDRQVPEVQ